MFQRIVNCLLQAGTAAALLEGVRRRDPSVIVNGIVSIAFAALPGVLERRAGVRFRPWQRVVVSAAALVHTLGMLGPYDRIWWWDHVAHTLSGAVVAGATDVVFRLRIESVSRQSSDRFRAAFVVGATVGFGLVWEALEHVVHAFSERVGIEPLLVEYSRLDPVLDLFFDAVGAGIVVLFGRPALSNVVESVADDDRGPHSTSST